MRRYICQQNIAHFEALLGKADDPALCRTLHGLLATARRELALLESDVGGADLSPFEHQRRQRLDAESVREEFRSEFDNSPHPYMLLDPGPGLRIVDINDAYAKATFIRREDVVGQSLFGVFPDNPADALADGVSNLFASLRIVVQTGEPHAMAVQRYDIRDPHGEFVVRHWQPINTPIHDRKGHLIFLLHHVEDVTAEVARRN